LPCEVTLPVPAPHVAGPASDPLAALEATLARARSSPLYRDRLAGARLTTLDDLRRLPLTTRTDLQRAGTHGLRAVPLEAVCHYGETSGTTGGATNVVWLTAGDLARSAEAIRAAHPDVFAPGRIVLNRFPFMAAPAHLIQLIAQGGGGVAIPAGNINWDVPFPRALELARQTGAQVIAGLPLEPIVLGRLARAAGLDPAADLAVDTLFLGGAPMPHVLQRRIAAEWGARVIELYGSTETMLLGTSCAEGTLHLETGLAHCEVLDGARREPVAPGGEGVLVVTTLGIEGSPLVRFDTGDAVRLLPPCACGDPRPGVIVLGRDEGAVEVAGARLHAFDLIDAAAAAADALGSTVFFVVILPDRILVRIEAEGGGGDAAGAFARRLPGIPVEIEPLAPGMLLDVEMLGRSPRVYKPVVLSDWRRPGRRLLTIGEGMMEWPRVGWAEGRRWLGRTLGTAVRRRRLARAAKLARGPGG
jgi:phenylacetate-coenzyme A ligase PaaK-like adenylate-forming protein